MEPQRAGKDPLWHIEETFYKPDRVRFYETLFTLANGYLGTRGSLEQGSQYGNPGTFFAGAFEVTLFFGRELVKAPDWTGLKVVAAGESLDLEKGTILDYRRILDMQTGVLFQFLRWQDPQGRVTRYESQRIVHRDYLHLGILRGRLIPENYRGPIALKAGLDGRVWNTSLVEPLKVKHFHPTDREDRGPDGLYLEMSTHVSNLAVGLASHLKVSTPAERTVEYFPEGLQEVISFPAEKGQAYEFEKWVTFFTTRDTENVSLAASTELQQRRQEGWSAVRERHVRSWAQRWHDADAEIEGDAVAQQSVRFALFHLLQSVPEHDQRTSIAAKALHGEGYRGHVFWDTEIFMLPFFIYTRPEAARSLLLYRYHLLDAARENARRNGYQGAQFPWESADTGEEVTPPELGNPFTGETVRIWTGEEEHHVTADVAYAVDHYVTATGDTSFMASYGAEIILETSRFWARRVDWDEGKQRYVIRRVIGPDEFHEHVDNNVFTNFLAQWNLRRAAEYVEHLARHQPSAWDALRGKLSLGEEEVSRWREMADQIFLPFNENTRLYEEFEGYFDREDWILTEFNAQQMPVLPPEVEGRVGQTQLVKQADVVMLHYLLNDSFSPESKRTNFEYYEARTTHRSSLSSSIYAIMGVEVGEREKAYQNFLRTARVDLEDNQGNTADGIHAAALGGTWQVVVNGFAGLRIREGKLTLQPWLPPHWSRLAFRLKWHGETLRLTLQPQVLEVCQETAGPPVTLRVGEQMMTLCPGKSLLISWKGGDS